MLLVCGLGFPARVCCIVQWESWPLGLWWLGQSLFSEMLHSVWDYVTNPPTAHAQVFLGKGFHENT